MLAITNNNMPRIHVKTDAPKPSYMPKCPNHGCALEGCGFPLPRKGEGICPVSVSGAHFEFEVEVDDDKMVGGLKKDKNGNMVKGSSWKVAGEETGIIVK